MSRTGTLIERHRTNFPEHKYYTALLEKASSDIVNFPDITIETCKAVLDGISKTILNKCDVDYKEKGRNIDTTAQLFRKATAELQKYCELDEEVIHAAAGTILRITNIRNDRGDISHGKSVPKENSSDVELARFVYEITDSISHYLLEKFFLADWSIFDEVVYEDNESFNEILDENNPMSGVLKYSRALYDQDRVTYEEQLQDYRAELENEY